MREREQRGRAVDAALEQLRRAVIAEELAHHPEIQARTRLVRRVLSGAWDRHQPGDSWLWTFQAFTICQPRILTIAGADGWTVRSIFVGSELITRDVPAESFPPLPRAFARLDLDDQSVTLPTMTIGELREVAQTIDRWFESLENLPRLTLQPGIFLRVELVAPTVCGWVMPAERDRCTLPEGHAGEHRNPEPTRPALALHVVQPRDE